MSVRRATTGWRLPGRANAERDGAISGDDEDVRGYRRFRWFADTRVARAGAWILVFAGLFVYARSFRHTYVDDTYITLQYARNLAEHLTWGFLPDRTANTATSPLNVVLLALFGRLTPGATVDAIAWLTAAQWTLMLAILLRLSRLVTGGPHFGLFAFAGLVTNPLLLSTIGLEAYLYVLLMILSLAAFVEGRWRLLGAALALLVLARPDGALLAVLLFVLIPGGFRSQSRAGLAFVLTALPWYLFSWIHLGSFVPDTLLIKLNQSAWGATTFADGLRLYRHRFGSATDASLWLVIFAPFAPLAIWRADGMARRAIAALIASAVAHYAFYSTMGVPPFHWYYTQEVAALVILGALGAAALLDRTAMAQAQSIRWASLALTALPVLGLGYFAFVDGWPARAAPIATNWGLPDQYRALGLELRGLVRPSQVVDLRGEIGTVAYYCRCRVVDDFADPNRTDKLVSDLRADASGPISFLLAVNFAWREPEAALPTATRVLDFDPVDRGQAAPTQGLDALKSWTVSSSWVPQTVVTLRALTLLSFEVQLRAPDGTALPPEDQPTLEGDYVIFTVAGGPEHGVVASGRWVDNRASSIPVPPFTDLVIRVSHPEYGSTDSVINITGIGMADYVAGLTVRAPPSP